MLYMAPENAILYLQAQDSYTYGHKSVILTGTRQLYLRAQVSYTYRGKSVILTGASQLYLQGQVSYTPTPSSPAGRHRSSVLCVPTGRVRGRGKRCHGLLPNRRKDAEGWPC